ncbi:MAG: hypothetical protein ABSH48_18000 [Verrucomicrobiota bacterium]|jgi:hypothetical protein
MRIAWNQGQLATNHWVLNDSPRYYTPPTRNWAFDLNFQNSAKLPPLTPQMRAMIRGNWLPTNSSTPTTLQIEDIEVRALGAN